MLGAACCAVGLGAGSPAPVQAQAQFQLAKADANIDPALVGTWTSGLGRLDFNADGTGRHYVTEVFGVPLFSHPFKWSVSGNQLIWTGADLKSPATYSIQKGVLTIGEDWYLDRL
ncbi:hypothetical protein AQ619_06550 [Caulobacter henricii]|uniref:Uncharacterized protein n=1 Tax=Caulobacter henricii TaxID=69395 RepID=A0A0P0NYW2_9CAUL|nr:hypothetical protein AQ619_06550 [Caulobacter henricii]